MSRTTPISCILCWSPLPTFRNLGDSRTIESSIWRTDWRSVKSWRDEWRFQIIPELVNVVGLRIEIPGGRGCNTKHASKRKFSLTIEHVSFDRSRQTCCLVCLVHRDTSRNTATAVGLCQKRSLAKERERKRGKTNNSHKRTKEQSDLMLIVWRFLYEFFFFFQIRTYTERSELYTSKKGNNHSLQDHEKLDAMCSGKFHA